MIGTPKTIEEAIRNGIHSGADGLPEPLMEHLSEDIRKHVKDFLAQRFGVATQETMELWKRIFPEDGPTNREGAVR